MSPVHRLKASYFFHIMLLRWCGRKEEGGGNFSNNDTESIGHRRRNWRSSLLDDDKGSVWACALGKLTSGQILSPWLGDIVDSGIGLSYRPASLCIAWRAGTTTLFQSRLNPPSQGIKIWLLRRWDGGWGEGKNEKEKGKSNLSVNIGHWIGEERVGVFHIGMEGGEERRCADLWLASFFLQTSWFSPDWKSNLQEFCTCWDWGEGGWIGWGTIVEPIPYVKVLGLFNPYTDKKENRILLINKEIQNGAVAKSYMTKHLHISHILGSPSSYMTLQPLPSEFAYIWGKFYFLSYQCIQYGTSVYVLSLHILVRKDTRVADPDPNWIQIQSGQRIRIQEGKSDPQN